MQSLMQIYKEYPNLGSMLQLGYCAAYMQLYAATLTFLEKNYFKYSQIQKYDSTTKNHIQ